MRQPEDEGDRKLLADITTFGWHVMNVFEEPDSPPFSYSIGLFHSFKHPEIILIGLGSKVAHPIINIAGEEIRAGRTFLSGQEYDDFLDGYPSTFRTVPERQYPPYLGAARWFYEGNGFPALQLIFPDKHNRWPWNPDTHPDFRARQPVLADSPLPPWAL